MAFVLFSGQLSIDNGGPIDNDFGTNNPSTGNSNEGISPPPLNVGVSGGPNVGPADVVGGGSGVGDQGSDGGVFINGVGAGSNGS